MLFSKVTNLKVRYWSESSKGYNGTQKSEEPLIKASHSEWSLNTWDSESGHGGSSDRVQDRCALSISPTEEEIHSLSRCELEVVGCIVCGIGSNEAHTECCISSVGYILRRGGISSNKVICSISYGSQICSWSRCMPICASESGSSLSRVSN